MCSVGADHKIKVDFDLAGPFPWRRGAVLAHFKPGLVQPEVGARELMVEEECDIRHLFEHVEEPLVEPAAVGCENCLLTSDPVGAQKVREFG